MVGSGNWRGSSRRLRLPADWPQRRRLVLERDQYTCRIRTPGICVGRATDADHVIAGDDHGVEALQAACGPCHRRKSAEGGTAAQARRRAATKRPVEAHPAYGPMWD